VALPFIFDNRSGGGKTVLADLPPESNQAEQAGAEKDQGERLGNDVITYCDVVEFESVICAGYPDTIEISHSVEVHVLIRLRTKLCT